MLKTCAWLLAEVGFAVTLAPALACADRTITVRQCPPCEGCRSAICCKGSWCALQSQGAACSSTLALHLLTWNGCPVLPVTTKPVFRCLCTKRLATLNRIPAICSQPEGLLPTGEPDIISNTSMPSYAFEVSPLLQP